MTIADWLVLAMVKLQKAEVPNGRREAIILLADLFQKDKSWIHTHPEHILNDLQIRELNFKVKRRTQRIPLAYIRGFAEFYGRLFMVNSHVLIPRPESENFIPLLRELQLELPRIADIGTGSGCLAISAALEMPEATVHAYDLSPDALMVTKYNAKLYHVKIRAIQSNLLKNLHKHRYDAMLVNLPYVPKDLITSPEITKEPRIALFSGKDGLDHYRAFWDQIQSLQHKPKYILTESLEEQQDSLESLAVAAGYDLEKTDVLIQRFTLQ